MLKHAGKNKGEKVASYLVDEHYYNLFEESISEENLRKHSLFSNSTSTKHDMKIKAPLWHNACKRFLLQHRSSGKRKNCSKMNVHKGMAE